MLAMRDSGTPSLLKRIVSLMVGLAAVAGVAGLISISNPPSGAFGEVVRHNLAENIDATTLLYTEHEGIHDLEEDLRAAKESCRLAQASR